ncbi:DEAD/DEAH box helicase [Glutamicibacter sp. PS]|uniref:DEAD/DEAH box helicase n=1 Tax=Glutamicibacter sp. PS TaxID=3075634 RepID=UPI002848C106|nr:DEAD/DEAH box helicase [Glutamicibacter sp. PS]MDR4534198.1 SNF2 family helicase [Glutamicibacter sp. PS]
MARELNFAQISSLLSTTDVAKGQLLVLQRQVKNLRAQVEDAYMTFDGSVLGVRAMARFAFEGRSVSASAYCAVDAHGFSCEHVAALLLDATKQRSDLFTRPGSTRTREPHWRIQLSDLLPHSAPVDIPELEPLGLLLKVTPNNYIDDSGYEVKARPVHPGARGTNWVQSGVSWRGLAFDERFEEAQREAVFSLVTLQNHHHGSNHSYGNYYGDDWVVLNGLPGEKLRSIFERIRATEVPLIKPGAASRQVIGYRAEQAHAGYELTRHDGHARLAARIEAPGAESQDLAPLGRPALLTLVGSAPLDQSETLELAEFDAPLHSSLRSLARQGAITIPEDALPEFERSFLPRVQQTGPLTSPDHSYAIPAPPRPVLEVALATREEFLGVDYRWVYPQHVDPNPELEQEIIDELTVDLAEVELGPVRHRRFPSATLNPSQKIDFVLHALPVFRAHRDVRVLEDEQLPDYKMAAGSAQVHIQRPRSSNDWFDLGIEVQIDGQKVPFVQLFEALTRGDSYLELDGHRVLKIDGEEMERLRALIAEAGELSKVTPEGVRMHKLSVDWWQELVALGIIEAQENEWLHAMRQLSDTETLAEVELPESFTATLRGYQRQGVAWLDFLRRHQLGGVLADDMGLGKTVQLLAALERARIQHPEQRYLVVAPTSVVGNWASEAARFTPQLRTATVLATAKKQQRPLAETVGTAQLVLTSYAIFRLDFEQFDALGFDVLILDEAQQLKNHVSKGYKQARQMAVPTKLVVTGTPMENNLTELWALASLAAPGLLGGLKAFKENYLKPITEGDAGKLQRLKRRIRPFIMRRTKEQVVPELPPKTEQVLEVELDPAHRRAYDRRFQRVRQEVLGLVQDDVDSNRFKILQSLTLLRQLALDPSLVDEGDAPSAKLDLLRDLLEDGVSEGHKILVFSQFTGFLSKARTVAEELGIAHGYLDGSVSGSNRKTLMEGFSAGEFPVFFISLKSGGFGINLTEADYCILLDPWWNPAAEAQAIDRAHRIGQDRPVYVYRLVSQNTIESKVLSLQAKKTELFNDVLGEQQDTAGSSTLSAQDFLELVQ